MSYENVLAYQEKLVQENKYRALSGEQRKQVRGFFKENIPDGFYLEGGKAPLFAASGMKVAYGYNRIVIGDYGPMIEMKPEDMVHENICVKKGQEYRDNDPRYSGNVKFSWLTTTDDSDIKIMFQKKPVGYADLVPGMYYVSPFECTVGKVQELESESCVLREDVIGWLKKHGVYVESLVDYYMEKASVYGDAICFAITHFIQPPELEMWFYIKDVCQAALDYGQYRAITYNLNVIGCIGPELNGTLEALKPEVRTAIEMGMDFIEIPYEMQKLGKNAIREILRLPAEDLLCVSHFSKVMAGHKIEDGVDRLIADANDRVVRSAVTVGEKDYVMS